jgi:NADH pyrophosphatase NudC (nudix superfamily)
MTRAQEAIASRKKYVNSEDIGPTFEYLREAGIPAVSGAVVLTLKRSQRRACGKCVDSENRHRHGSSEQASKWQGGEEKVRAT